MGGRVKRMKTIEFFFLLGPLWGVMKVVVVDIRGLLPEQEAPNRGNLCKKHPEDTNPPAHGMIQYPEQAHVVN